MTAAKSYAVVHAHNRSHARFVLPSTAPLCPITSHYGISVDVAFCQSRTSCVLTTLCVRDGGGVYRVFGMQSAIAVVGCALYGETKAALSIPRPSPSPMPAGGRRQPDGNDGWRSVQASVVWSHLTGAVISAILLDNLSGLCTPCVYLDKLDGRGTCVSSNHVHLSHNLTQESAKCHTYQVLTPD